MDQKVKVYEQWLKESGVYLPPHLEISPVEWGLGNQKIPPKSYLGLIHNPPTQEQDPLSERSSKRQKTGPSFSTLR